MIENSFVEQHNPPFRQGIVYALETKPPYRVRVQFPDRDNMISWWLPCLIPKIGSDVFFWQPDIGEMVACNMDEQDENGIVLGAIPSQAAGAPAGLGPANFYIRFQDGTILQYNRQTHALSIAVIAGGTVSLTAGGAGIGIDGGGNISITTTGSISFTQTGGAAADGLALVSKLITAFNTHTHGTPPTTAVPTVPWTPTTVSSGLVKVED